MCITPSVFVLLGQYYLPHDEKRQGKKSVIYNRLVPHRFLLGTAEIS